MSKKIKNRKPHISQSTPGIQMPSSAETIVQTAAAAQRSGYNTPQAFNPDYSNVIKDLKRIGVLAGTFFVVLVILSFFL